MLRPAVAATNWARAGNIGLDMRNGGSILVLAAPGWDFGAKVPARTEAVNDGAGHSVRLLTQDRPSGYLKCGGSS